MTHTATAPGSLRAAVQRLAQDLARDASNAAGQVGRTYRAIQPARDALSDAESLHRAAQADAIERAAMPGQLARALGWPLGIVTEEPDTRAYGGPSTTYRAAFGGGRVTSAPTKYHGTPKGRAYGWALGANGGRENAYDYEPAAGTNNPDKLRAQIDDATANLRAWLAGYTADAWLRAHNIDPAHRPPLVSLVAVTVDALRHYGPPTWYRPAWSLTLAGYEIAKTDDRREILTPGEEREHGYAGLDAVLGEMPLDDEDATRAYATRHAERARAALLRRFEYQPEPR